MAPKDLIARRQLLRLASFVAALAAGTRAAWPQAYPSRPVRVIVPFSPGGAVDIIGRVIAQRLSESLGAQFYVENIPTGASNVANVVTAKSPPDGHTLLFVTSSFVINPSYYRKVGYDAIKDFTPIALTAVSPHVLSVNPSLPVANVTELIALVKKNPGKYSYASAGTGQSAQLAAELFKLAYGLDIVHVPFNGGAPAMAATIAGHTQIAFNALPSAATFIKDGKVRALGMTSRTRDPEFPDIPTFTEQGVPDQESAFFVGIVGPAGMPRDIVGRLNRELVRIIALADVREKLTSIGYTAETDTPDDFSALIKAEIAQWAKVIRDSKMQQVE
ncbi:MAG TPA: tripartite tricarboxylate transporter substrate binding protein [Xanthobacteraceae bacterium]|jgi:tripartite-type tricarboxylate transporter receptor subunit TctC|nr:tripartite tricarboxylate transporter substrate binding protein [Xanthobacteraceae bacterium]